MSDAGRPLRLSDRAAIETELPARARGPAEWYFANLYLFRERHAYRLHDRPVAHLRGVTYDGAIHALPLVPLDDAVAEALFADGVGCLYPLPDRSALAGDWHFVEADSDYWFDGRAMAEMRFSRLRRDEASAFAEHHGPCLDAWDAEAAVQVLEGWLADVARPAEATDVTECREAITLAGDLGLEGAVVRIRAGEPVAFLLASACPPATRIVHFAKGRRAFPGAYGWMFAHYARASEAALLNFEQDLGNPGLAQSKRAFAPIERRPKWRLQRTERGA